MPSEEDAAILWKFIFTKPIPFQLVKMLLHTHCNQLNASHLQIGDFGCEHAADRKDILAGGRARRV